MKIILKLEEAAMFFVSVFFFYRMDLPGWWFWAFLLAPDLGMLGYLINTKVGAITYNITHHKAIATVVFILGYVMASVNIEFIGVIIFAHSSLDRVLGYGLKYTDSFQHTHLGTIGKV